MPIGQEAARIRESINLPNDVKDVQECLKLGLDPLHAAYVSVQNFVSFFAESVSIVDELESYAKIVGAAEDEYMPGGPPMSPLTDSYFSTWAFFDVRFGPDLETIGTCLLDIGAELGVNAGMLEITRHLQESRMGVYEHCGREGAKVRLRELLTDEMYTCHVGSAYVGRDGELWYARRCPPLVEQMDQHVILTTPYILLDAGKVDWVAYLNRQLLGASDLRTGLRELLKYGRSVNQWNEFIFLSYRRHQHDAIFLAGLPDVKGSLPHADLSRDS